MAESAASLPSDLPPPYRYSRSSERDIDGLKVLEVEVSDIKEGRSPRTHLRMIGGEGTDVAGRALVYTDLYSRTPEDKIYSYARHSVGQEELLQMLKEFLASAALTDYGELRNREARSVMQTRERLWEFTFPTYAAAIETMQREPLIFARLKFPFGDITVDFKEKADIPENEFRFLREGNLQRTLERPLFAYDATRSDVWTIFLSSIHWARDLVEREVLRQVLRRAIPAIAV